MKTSDFAYHLPEELIAQTPVTPRDHSRMLVYDRATSQVAHRHFGVACTVGNVNHTCQHLQIMGLQ